LIHFAIGRLSNWVAQSAKGVALDAVPCRKTVCYLDNLAACDYKRGMFIRAQ
jgi:hypothetical protein